ncbi:signal transduction histidine kinase [Kribbella orskensis]|uniref:histidine kinase n=1 Tax=Kribbella orskensis TaxID=2512216 RepID=A0ABY2BT18_9ACTN|nr:MULTISPECIES: HAMP domain-containing sensor histidine kinase [Kribbella]TCN44857.1 signal transduction histidine kinase [Kribbella sp. VKM Ac-2500]TCO31365.1 signal transduction histidine kinase [Kribbella orskensis]
MSGRPIGDEVLVGRAARSVAVQVAALVAVAMLLLIALVTIVVVRGQAGAADDLLRSAVATADDVGDPPAGAWLAMTGPAGTTVTQGLPDELLPELAAMRTGATGQVRLTTVENDDGEFRIATGITNGKPVQAVLDLATAHQERARLLQAMGFASALGLLFAGLLGVLIGRRAVRPLAQALSLQRTFVADAGHELRTPLTLLSTRAQVLDRALRRSGPSDEILRDSDGVVQDTKRLGEVVDDLLAAADPRGAADHGPVDLAQIAEDVADSAGAHAQQAGVRLRWHADEGSLVVLGAASAIRRATIALVDNAIDHTPADGEVRIAVRRHRREVILAVSDTGPGIGPEEAQRVLRRFDTGGHRAGRAHYGLGLALTHDVANRHGGQLRLAPSEVGATFELVLPAIEGPVPRKA